MKPIIKSIIYILLIAAITFASCKKMEKVSSPAPPRPTNKPLVANAGIDQVITLPMDRVILDGSASTGPIGYYQYQWSKISGPASSYIEKDQSSTSTKTVVYKLYPGVYQFQLKVIVNGVNGAVSAKDTMMVTVNNIVDTLSGREIIYNDLTWETSDFFGLGGKDTYVGFPKPPIHRALQVSIKLDYNSQGWIEVPYWDDRFPVPQNADYIYNAGIFYDNDIYYSYYSTLFVFAITDNSPYLPGSKVSIRVKIL